MGISFQPLERATVSEQIARRIIALISSGDLKPGDRLPSERDLMAQLQVSRSPVREALRSLSLIGLLETRPGDGTYVSEHLTDGLVEKLALSAIFSREEIFEWIEVREPLEVEAAGLAAARNTPGDLEHLAASIRNYAAASGSLEAMVDAEIAFHETILEMSGNTVLQRLLGVFYEILRTWVLTGQVPFAVEDHRQHGHDEILLAIQDGDVEAAREAMSRHLRRIRQQALVEELRGSRG